MLVAPLPGAEDAYAVRDFNMPDGPEFRFTGADRARASMGVICCSPDRHVAHPCPAPPG